MKMFFSRFLFYSFKAFVFSLVCVLTIFLIHSCGSFSARAFDPDDLLEWYGLIPESEEEFWQEVDAFFNTGPDATLWNNFKLAYSASSDEPFRTQLSNQARALADYVGALNYCRSAFSYASSDPIPVTLYEGQISSGWFLYNGEIYCVSVYAPSGINGEPAYYPNGRTLPLAISPLFSISYTMLPAENQQLTVHHPYYSVWQLYCSSATDSSVSFTSLTCSTSFFSSYPAYGHSYIYVAMPSVLSNVVTLSSGSDLLYYARYDDSVLRSLGGPLPVTSGIFPSSSPVSFSGSSIPTLLESVVGNLYDLYGSDTLDYLADNFSPFSSSHEEPSFDCPSWLYPGTAQMSTEHYEIDYNTSVQEPYIELETEAALPVKSVRLIGGAATGMTDLLKDTGLFPILIFLVIFSIVIGFLLF